MTRRYDRENGLAYEVLETRRAANGGSRSLLRCPFCWATFWAFWWSIAGGGKRCESCGAKHTSFGMAYRQIDNR